MKTIAIAASVIALGSVVVASHAARAQEAQARVDVEPGIYLRGSLGYSWSFEDDIDSSFLYGVGIGYRATPNIRVDFTVDWRDRYGIEGRGGFTAGAVPIETDLENQTYMFNLYYDLDQLPIVELPGALKPYIGAGIGIANNEVDDETIVFRGNVVNFEADDETQFGWQLMIGASYHFTENWSADLAYRYGDFGRITAESVIGKVEDDFTVSEIVATVRYRF